MGKSGAGRAVSAIIVALVAVAALIPLVSAQAHKDVARARAAPGADKLLFFAADGLRQDAVERYATGPSRASRVLRRGARASGGGLLTQAPPNTGAGWFTLATGAWPGVAGSTNNTFHVNGQPFAQPHGGLRPRRAAGRDDRPGGRARRQEGRPDRVGRRPRRRDRRADARLPQLPLRPRRGHELHRADRLAASFTAAFGLQFDHPDGFAGQAAVPAGARRRRRPAGPTCRASFSPAQEMRLRVLDAGDRQVRPQRLHLRQPRRRQHATTTACCSRRRRTATTPSATSPRASGPTSRSRSSGRRRSTARPARFLVKVERLAPDLSPGPAVPHVGDARDRHLADLARRARLHRRLRGLRRRALPVLAGRRLRRARGRASSARRPTSSRACTGRRPTTR